MAVEPATTEPTRHEMQVHVRDYDKFTKLFKYGAATVFVIAIVVLLIIGT
jgi:hypothetical protein